MGSLCHRLSLGYSWDHHVNASSFWVKFYCLIQPGYSGIPQLNSIAELREFPMMISSHWPAPIWLPPILYPKKDRLTELVKRLQALVTVGYKIVKRLYVDDIKPTPNRFIVWIQFKLSDWKINYNTHRGCHRKIWGSFARNMNQNMYHTSDLMLAMVSVDSVSNMFINFMSK